MRAVALMSVWKIKNALRTLISDPRKLIPVLLMIVLFAFPIGMLAFTRSMSHGMMQRAAASAARHRAAALQDQAKANGMAITKVKRSFDPSKYVSPRHEIDPALFSAAITFCLILIGIGIINTGLGDRLLALGPSDVDYLFPAPISRRVVLAYRLPGLTFGAVGIAVYVLFMISMFTQAADMNMPNPGTTISPWWVNPAALFLSGGIYLNLAMFISIRMKRRHLFQKGLWVGAAGLAGSFAVIGCLNGLEAAEQMANSPALKWMFLPSSLASETLVAAYSQQPTGQLLGWLCIGYLASMAVMFSTNANWYEQSIASTEKWSALRQAAKGGWSGVMAAKAASYNYKSAKAYTIPPFGQHAVALFWAHLCAAAKKPIPNFVVPLIAGAVLGGGSAIGLRSIRSSIASATHTHRPTIASDSLGYMVLFLLTFYCWQGFTTTSRSSSEASIRRRELMSPLPITGWQSVAADLGVPFCAIAICFLTCVVTYAAFGGPHFGLVIVGFGLTLPLRLAGRIVLQHIVVIAYPDLADKLQRFISMFVGAVVGTPFTIAELVVCLPGLFLHSIWGALIPLTLLQIPLLALFLYLAGKASSKAVASGEPINIFRIFRGKF